MAEVKVEVSYMDSDYFAPHPHCLTSSRFCAHSFAVMPDSFAPIALLYGTDSAPLLLLAISSKPVSSNVSRSEHSCNALMYAASCTLSFSASDVEQPTAASSARSSAPPGKTTADRNDEPIRADRCNMSVARSDGSCWLGHSTISEAERIGVIGWPLGPLLASLGRPPEGRSLKREDEEDEDIVFRVKARLPLRNDRAEMLLQDGGLESLELALSNGMERRVPAIWFLSIRLPRSCEIKKE